MKNPAVQNVLHWLLVASGFLASLSSFAGWAHWIPGRIGQVLVLAFVLLVSVERLLIVIEQVLEGRRSAAEAAEDVVKDAEEIAGDVNAVAKAAEPFIKNAPK